MSLKTRTNSFSSAKPFGMSNRPEQQTTAIRKLAEAKKRMAELDEEINKLYESTIGGFNSMIEQQKKAKGEALVSTVLTQ